MFYPGRFVFTAMFVMLCVIVIALAYNALSIYCVIMDRRLGMV